MTGDRSPAFLGTSYVVRCLVNDPPDMAQRAADVIDSEEILMLSEMVLLETAYVLTSVYSVPRAAAVESLIELVQRANHRLTTLPKAGILRWPLPLSGDQDRGNAVRRWPKAIIFRA